MYRPQNFAEDRLDVLINAIRNIQFAAIVTPTQDGIEVTHAPVVIHPGETVADTTIETHVARANPHWRAAVAAQSVAIFQGPHSYVTPSWYPSKQEHGKVVPTWTYVTVHAHGTLEAIQDDTWLARHLEELTNQNEVAREVPWAVSDAPTEFIGSLSRGIVGLRMRIDRLEGAWKLNQHKATPDRDGTARGLANAGEMEQQLSDLLTKRAPS
ncbi:FMN-binding negative transcriptional regulator [Tritonibacter mobilis]|nr:FMN-binding negative transcriptional regulator [Tritonibacter mobilis]